VSDLSLIFGTKVPTTDLNLDFPCDTCVSPELITRMLMLPARFANARTGVRRSKSQEIKECQ
ncbi:MAG: hypothetical protein ACKO2Z_12620, partial [Sphaerospermopsis kisseleviana]